MALAWHKPGQQGQDSSARFQSIFRWENATGTSLMCLSGVHWMLDYSTSLISTFLPSFIPKAFGKGVHFARDASYSANPMYAIPDRNGNQCIMACRVAVGEYCRGKVKEKCNTVIRFNNFPLTLFLRQCYNPRHSRPQDSHFARFDYWHVKLSHVKPVDQRNLS